MVAYDHIARWLKHNLSVLVGACGRMGTWALVIIKGCSNHFQIMSESQVIREDMLHVEPMHCIKTGHYMIRTFTMLRTDDCGLRVYYKLPNQRR